MGAVTFDYRLIGVGFCEAVFRVGDAELNLTLGDQPDPLEELMTAALALARGEQPPKLLWDPEDGGYYVWYLSRHFDRVIVRVDYDLENGGRGTRPPGIVIEAGCPVIEFCTVVADRAAAVITEYGPDRYTELWFAPFPFELLTALQAEVSRF